MAPDHAEFDERVLCPDEMCTGVLGEDGVCGTCGARGEVPLGRAASSVEAGEGEDGALDGEAGDDETELPGDDAGDADESRDEPVDPDERRPCPDEMCTGIVGADATCGTCGRAA